jgi:hypothetical protein
VLRSKFATHFRELYKTRIGLLNPSIMLFEMDGMGYFDDDDDDDDKWLHDSCQLCMHYFFTYYNPVVLNFKLSNTASSIQHHLPVIAPQTPTACSRPTSYSSVWKTAYEQRQIAAIAVVVVHAAATKWHRAIFCTW